MGSFILTSAMALVFLVGRTHHHYKHMNGPLETAGQLFSLAPLPPNYLSEGFIFRITYLTNESYNTIRKGSGTHCLKYLETWFQF